MSPHPYGADGCFERGFRLFDHGGERRRKIIRLIRHDSSIDQVCVCLSCDAAVVQFHRMTRKQEMTTTVLTDATGNICTPLALQSLTELKSSTSGHD